MLEAVLGQPEGVAYLRKVVDGTFTLPLLLVGEQGVGRRLSVFEAAKAVFEPEQHVALERGHHPDFHFVRVEEDKDIKVESVRTMIEDTQVLPAWAPYKYFVIDGADRLTIAAANALLKVLEEPPVKARFFLLSEQLETVIPTIRSRCAIVSYRRLPESLILSKLLEVTDDETKARVYARVSEGSLGRAMRCFVAGELAFRDEMSVVLHLAARRDLPGLFAAVDKVADLPMGVRFLGQILRDLLVLEVAPGRVIHLDILETLRRLRTLLPTSVVHRLLEALRELRCRAEAPISFPFHVKSVLASACA